MGFVHDPAIASKERYRLAKILRGGGDVEWQPYLSGLYLCIDVETERRVVKRVSSKSKERGLRSGGMRSSRLFKSCSDKPARFSKGVGSIS
jgi:hypothetical protein